MTSRTLPIALEYDGRLARWRAHCPFVPGSEVLAQSKPEAVRRCRDALVATTTSRWPTGWDLVWAEVR